MSICSAEDECIELCRFSEREKRFDGLRASERHKVSVQGGYPRERTPVRLQDIYKEDASSDRLIQDLPNPFTDGKQQNAPAKVL